MKIINNGIFLEEGDDIIIKTNDIELFILCEDGKTTVSNETTFPPSIIEALADGWKQKQEGNDNRKIH